MRKLLSTNLSRQLTILDLLIESSRSMQELREKLQVDDKTIRKSVTTINMIINPLKVGVNKIGNYEIKWLENYDVNYINASFFNESIEFQILEKILIDETLTYNELADATFISVSTLRRAIIRMNEVLAEYDMEIVSTPIRVRGDEHQILKFLYNYLKGKYMITTNFLTPLESDVIDDVLEDALTKFDMTWSFTLSETIKWLIKTHVIRIKNGNKLKVSQTTAKSELGSKTTLVVKTQPYRERLEKFFGIPFILQFIDMISQEKYALTIEDLSFLRERDERVNKKVVAIESIVNKIEESLSEKHKRKAALVLTLYNAAVFEDNNMGLLLDPNWNFITKLKNDKPIFFHELSEAYSQYSNVLDNQYFSRFSFYLITEWEELFCSFNKTDTKMRVGLFFSTTNAHIDFLKDEFQRKLSSRISVVNLNSYKLTQLDELDVDLILTNISNLSAKIPSIYVANYPGEEDIFKISRVYERWLRQERSS